MRPPSVAAAPAGRLRDGMTRNTPRRGTGREMIWQGQGANRPEQRGQVMYESSAGATRSRSDADILNAIRSGDPVAYGLLRRRHMPAARRLAQFLLNGSAAAEDAV